MKKKEKVEKTETDIILSQYDIEKMIVTIRGEQVLIDRDLAMIYGIETKRLNEQVKRNIARFPERYRFQLTKDEMMELVANCDRFKTLKHSTTTAYAKCRMSFGIMRHFYGFLVCMSAGRCC